MQLVTLYRIDDGDLLIQKLSVAQSWMERTVGLLNRSSLAADEALMINRCRWVHSFGMRFPIDLLFVDSQLTIVHAQALLQHRVSPIVWRARHTIELPHGCIKNNALRVGQRLRIEE